MVPTNEIHNKHVSQFGLKSVPGSLVFKKVFRLQASVARIQQKWFNALLYLVEQVRRLVLNPCVHPKLLELDFLEWLLRNRRAALYALSSCEEVKHPFRVPLLTDTT